MFLVKKANRADLNDLFLFNFQPQFVNIILSISNLIGLLALYNFYINNNYLLTISLLSVITMSALHHLSETNEVGHNLPGLHIPMLYKYSHVLRYIDICSACVFTISVIYSYGLSNIRRFSNNHLAIICLAFMCSFFCDFIIRKNPILYLIFHIIWHSGIYYIIYKLSLIN